MTHTKLYVAIFAVLFVGATAQVLIEFAGLPFETAITAIMALSMFKAVLVAGWFQHLRWEPRSLTYLMTTALLAVLALTVAAAYSIQ